MIQLSKFLDTENIFISLRSREIPFPTSPVWRIVELQTTVSFGQFYISSSHSVVRFPLSLRIYVHIFREESRRNFCSICLKSRSSQRSPRSILVHPHIISFTESNMLQEPTKKKIQPRRGDERAQRDPQVLLDIIQNRREFCQLKNRDPHLLFHVSKRIKHWMSMTATRRKHTNCSTLETMTLRPYCPRPHTTTTSEHSFHHIKQSGSICQVVENPFWTDDGTEREGTSYNSLSRTAKTRQSSWSFRARETSTQRCLRCSTIRVRYIWIIFFVNTLLRLLLSVPSLSSPYVRPSLSSLVVHTFLHFFHNFKYPPSRRLSLSSSLYIQHI